MFGSIYIGLSGLSAYSRGLQQISNNVANLNAQGFKGSSVSFESLMGGGDRGGLGYASRDVGDGVRFGTTTMDLAQGELRQTDRDLDLAIDGSGFLMLTKGDEIAYTRTGSFEVDKDGYVVLSGTQYRLTTLDAAGKPVALSVDASRTSPPKPTTKITFADNLSSSGTTANVSNINVYDAAGTKHVWQVAFTKDTGTGPNNWKVAVTDDKGTSVGNGAISFTNGVIDPAASTLTIGDSSGTSVTLDFSQGVTSYSSGDVSTLRAASVDGYGSGTLTTLTVNTNGQLEIGYSNDQKKQLGSIAIATFRDSSKLDQQSGGLFVDKGGADPDVLASGDVRVGKVQSRRLEASNVDLTLQFSDLILVQRGFQASSQIISVTNDMIQQLFGIRGQG